LNSCAPPFGKPAERRFIQTKKGRANVVELMHGFETTRKIPGQLIAGFGDSAGPANHLPFRQRASGVCFHPVRSEPNSIAKDIYLVNSDQLPNSERSAGAAAWVAKLLDNHHEALPSRARAMPRKRRFCKPWPPPGLSRGKAIK
jgi:hypothetical protein